MIPATANIEVCLMNNRDHWDYYNGFWGDVYGFKMNSMKKKTKYEAQVIAMDSRHVGSKLQELIKWNLKTCSIADLTFSSKIDLRIELKLAMNMIGVRRAKIQSHVDVLRTIFFDAI